MPKTPSLEGFEEKISRCSAEHFQRQFIRATWRYFIGKRDTHGKTIAAVLHRVGVATRSCFWKGLSSRMQVDSADRDVQWMSLGRVLPIQCLLYHCRHLFAIEAVEAVNQTSILTSY